MSKLDPYRDIKKKLTEVYWYKKGSIPQNFNEFKKFITENIFKTKKDDRYIDEWEWVYKIRRRIAKEKIDIFWELIRVLKMSKKDYDFSWYIFPQFQKANFAEHEFYINIDWVPFLASFCKRIYYKYKKKYWVEMFHIDIQIIVEKINYKSDFIVNYKNIFMYYKHISDKPANFWNNGDLMIFDDDLILNNCCFLGDSIFNKICFKGQISCENSYHTENAYFEESYIWWIFSISYSKISMRFNMPRTILKNKFLCIDSRIWDCFSFIHWIIDWEFLISKTHINKIWYYSYSLFNNSVDFNTAKIWQNVNFIYTKFFWKTIFDFLIATDINIRNIETKKWKEIKMYKVSASSIRFCDSKINCHLNLWYSFISNTLDLRGINFKNWSLNLSRLSVGMLFIDDVFDNKWRTDIFDIKKDSLNILDLRSLVYEYTLLKNSYLNSWMFEEEDNAYYWLIHYKRILDMYENMETKEQEKYKNNVLALSWDDLFIKKIGFNNTSILDIISKYFKVELTNSKIFFNIKSYIIENRLGNWLRLKRLFIPAILFPLFFTIISILPISILEEKHEIWNSYMSVQYSKESTVLDYIKWIIPLYFINIQALGSLVMDDVSVELIWCERFDSSNIYNNIICFINKEECYIKKDNCESKDKLVRFILWIIFTIEWAFWVLVLALFWTFLARKVIR